MASVRFSLHYLPRYIFHHLALPPLTVKLKVELTFDNRIVCMWYLDKVVFAAVRSRIVISAGVHFYQNGSFWEFVRWQERQWVGTMPARGHAGAFAAHLRVLWTLCMQILIYIKIVIYSYWR
jgi:hypothetical protein